MKTTKTIARVNKTSILMIENGDRLVPIKPICEALGIAHQRQIEKIKSDEILSSTVTLGVTVGGDKKEREMTCLPLKFVFGWLFTINPKNVNPEARETVIKYKLECYEALYRHFTDHTNFLEQKQKAVLEAEEHLKEIKTNFNTAKNLLKDAEKQFGDAINYPFEEWLANNRQLKIEFAEPDPQPES